MSSSDDLRWIAVSSENYNKLRRLGFVDHSFNDVITELLKKTDKTPEQLELSYNTASTPSLVENQGPERNEIFEYTSWFTHLLNAAKHVLYILDVIRIHVVFVSMW